jgi:uncharacterized protein (TIGR02147 family)
MGVDNLANTKRKIANIGPLFSRFVIILPTMKPVTDYLEYRDFLRDFYNAKKNDNPFFSYRYIAQKLSIDASHVVKILQKQRHIGSKLTENVINLCQLKGKEAEYFSVLVHFNKAKTDRECKRCYEQLLALKGVKAFTLQKNQYEFFQKWYYSAILTLFDFYQFRNDYKALAAKLSPPITESQAIKAVILLRKLKMIRKKKDGTFELTKNLITTGERWRSIAITSFQEGILRLGLESFDRHAREERNISTHTLTLAKDDLGEADEILKGCRAALLKLANNQKKPERVYQLCFQLFPVSV